MNILVLFDGAGCVSNTARKLGHNVFSSDILSGDHITYVTDILDFDKSKVPFNIDFIWASPPCETWSICTATGGGNRYWVSVKDKNKVIDITERVVFDETKRFQRCPNKAIGKRELHTMLLEKTVELIRYYNPPVWVIENPATGYMRHYLKRLINFYDNKTTYCQYGLTYRKETSLFSNIILNLKHCKKGDPCHGDHLYPSWEEGKDRIFKQKMSYLEKSQVPDLLINDVINQVSSYVDRLVLV